MLKQEPTVNIVYFVRLGVVTVAKRVVRDLKNLKSILEFKLKSS